MAAPRSIARYEVMNRIGRGGMGALYLARDPNIDRLVAIKLLHADLDREDLRERFAREARSAGALNHPNIVTIFDYGLFEEAPFIVMEYIRGETLAELVKRRAPLPLSEKLSLLDQLCRGLAYAHAAGIIHRDIKPANLMVDQQGVLKILDFGIARLTDSGMTSASMPIGTPGYMSPEQIEGHHVDRASDVFAVGAVAYELLTFSPAFVGNSQLVIINKVLHSQPPSIPTLAPDVAPEIAAVVERALEKHAGARYPDVVSLQRDLKAARLAQASTRHTPEPTTLVAPAGPSVLPRRDPGAAAGRAGEDSRLERVRAAVAAGELSAARDVLDEILASDPGQTEALALRQRIERDVEEGRIDDLLEQARAGLAENRLTDAGELVSRALRIQPQSEAARQLRSQLDARRLELRLRAAGTTKAKVAIAWGRWYLDQKAWGAARRSADEALALDPDNAEAIALRDEADIGAGRDPARPPADPILVAPAVPVPDTVAKIPSPAPAPPVARPASRAVMVWILGVAAVVVAIVAIVMLNRPRGVLPPPPASVAPNMPPPVAPALPPAAAPAGAIPPAIEGDAGRGTAASGSVSTPTGSATARATAPGATARGPALPSAETQSKVKTLLAEADQYYQDEKYDLALAKIAEALGLSRGNLDALKLKDTVTKAKDFAAKRKRGGGGGRVP